MLRRPKRSKNEVVAPKEEEAELERDGVFTNHRHHKINHMQYIKILNKLP